MDEGKLVKMHVVRLEGISALEKRKKEKFQILMMISTPSQESLEIFFRDFELAALLCHPQCLASLCYISIFHRR